MIRDFPHLGGFIVKRVFGELARTNRGGITNQILTVATL